MEPKIILIGGAPGVGKSTLSLHIMKEFHIVHKIGTGFLREIVKNHVAESQKEVLEEYSFAVENSADVYSRQCNILMPSIQSCINRAHREGTSIVIEGTHINPLTISKSLGKIIILTTSNDDPLRFKSKTHLFRNFSKEQLEQVKALDRKIQLNARETQIPIFDSFTQRKEILAYLRGEFNE